MMKKVAILLMTLFLASTSYACGIGEQVDGYENASVQHAHEHWQAGSQSPIPFFFLDVRTPEEYAEGHVEGSTLIPVEELKGRLSEVPKDKRVYVYCHSGKRSAAASGILVKSGFTNIENIEGGINAWKEAGYPVVK